MRVLVMTKPSIHFLVSAPDLHTHLFHVTLRIACPEDGQVLALPTWIPGSYLIREFSGKLLGLQARQGKKPCAVQQMDKNHWQLACTGGRPLEVSYQVQAHDASVRTAWLDADRGFFNASSLCLMVQGQTDGPHHLTIESPARHWELATGLEPVRVNARGFGQYVAADYDELADCPVEMGAFWSATFEACGVPHRFVIAHPPPVFDAQRLLQDTRRICETVMRFWHGRRASARLVPFKRYLLMLNAVGSGYGGLEHRNSTALMASRKCLPRVGQQSGADYVSLLGLISHEYFHAWNVKRLKPADFVPYDYHRENYTDLLWFFEGLTSYYDDLLLLRAGCIDLDGYLAQLQKTIDSVCNSPGRLVHSVAQASFEAWTKFYRADAHTPNLTVSYYAKGALVGLCLDLILRREGKTTLDAVMRALYARCCADPAAPTGMREEDVRAVLHELGGRSFDREINAWVHGTDELPLRTLLQPSGVQLVPKDADPGQQWGLRCKEGGSLQVQAVLRGGVAERAGFAPGDEWLAVEVPDAMPGAGTVWRVGSLAEVAALLPPYAGCDQKGRAKKGEKPQKILAWVARDRRIVRLKMVLPAQAPQRWVLQLEASARNGGDTPCWPWEEGAC